MNCLMCGSNKILTKGSVHILQCDTCGYGWTIQQRTGPFDILIERAQDRRAVDKKRYEELDHDTCMLCGAEGPDMRSLWMRNGYAIHEVVAEMIDTFAIEELGDLKGFYYLLTCKSCRSSLLRHMQDWRSERVALRGRELSHDGYLMD